MFHFSMTYSAQHDQRPDGQGGGEDGQEEEQGFLQYVRFRSQAQDVSHGDQREDRTGGDYVKSHCVNLLKSSFFE